MKPKDDDEPFEPEPEEFPPEPTYPPWKDPKEVPGKGWEAKEEPEEGPHPQNPGDEMPEKGVPKFKDPGDMPDTPQAEPYDGLPKGWKDDEDKGPF